MRTLADLDAAVAEGKTEILEDHGVQFENWPASFSELHDYVDANEYCGFCDPDRRADWPIKDVAIVQDRLDSWIKILHRLQR